MTVHNLDERRDESPKERGLRRARTDPKLRDHLACNLFGARERVWAPERVWDLLTDEERDHWRAALLRELEGGGEPAPDISGPSDFYSVNEDKLHGIDRADKYFERAGWERVPTSEGA